ncbi:MAG: tetratricopeptide repeat protein [Planctomycetales bacterium]|nr:tetratricopeptide repeat protein [Planctomycetales bacterium]
MDRESQTLKRLHHSARFLLIATGHSNRISMASEIPSTESPQSALSPAERQRLQKVFEHGQERHSKQDYDYAHDMFSACVMRDPSNFIYVDALLDNLQKKFKNNKKGGRSKGNRNAFKKAVQAEDWKQALEVGLDLLKYNPWDIPTLRGVAEGCAAQHYNEVELRYLKNALEAKPKDIDVNVHCARSLARMGQFDQAIACWHRVEDLLANKSEAQQMISKLTMAKNKWAQGIIDEELMIEVAGRPASPPPPHRDNGPQDATAQKPPSPTQATSDTPPQETDNTLSPSAQLQRDIVADPTNIDNYLKLAKLHESAGELARAEQVLNRALGVSGNNFQVQEALEDVQVVRAKHRLAVAKQRASDEPSDEATDLFNRLKDELNRLELDIYERRSRRYPDDMAARYELGIRLKRAKNYAEAAKYLEESRQDPHREPLAALYQGECLQQLRKYQPALQAYQAAVKAAPETAEEVLKLALYRAGTLAAGLKDHETAVNHLKKLLSLDPNYGDARERLDKIEPKGHK